MCAAPAFTEDDVKEDDVKQEKTMDHYAVIGNPIKHSLSPTIHREFAKQTQQDIDYIAIESPLDDFNKTLFNFRQQGGKGVNVTLPFKHQAFLLAAPHSDLAKQAFAANTLVFQEDNIIYADNTDGTGLIQDLTHNHNYSLQQKKILLLGAGGSAQGIVCPLLESAPTQLVIANRTPEKALQLAKQFEVYGNVLGRGMNDLNLAAGPYDLIINATSTGLSEQTLNLPSQLICKTTWCYDLMYGKITPFLTWAQQHHADNCLDGLGMLVEQAAAAFYLWRGVYPDTQRVISMLTEQ